VVVEGEAVVGRFVRIPLLSVVSELKIPEGGVVSAAKFDGVSKGLAIVQDKATGVWYVEGVPTEVQDYLTQPMFVRVTVTVGSTKSVVLCPLELRIREAEPMAFRSGRINVPYSGSFVTSFWPSAAVDTKNWKITGWPSGIKCNLSSKPITGKDSKTKAVVTMALPYEVYGKPTKAGRFTVKVTHKVVSASKKSYTENYTADFLVETDKGAIRYSDQAYVALMRTLDADVVSVSGQPSGLKADVKTHQVSGTPTKAGVFVTTYKRTDPTNAKKTISDTFLWEITPGENDGILHRIGWKDAEVEERCVWLEQGKPYQFLVDVPTGAKVTASGLPSGLSMKAVVTNAATKAKATLIAGIPSAVADYVATFKTVMNGVTVTERVAMRVGNSTKIPMPAEYGPFTPGVFASVDLMSFADCKVMGLPTGMKLVSLVDKTSKKTLKYAVEGIPTAYGRFVVTFTKTVDKVKYVAVSTFVVSDYPEIPLAVRLASKRTDGGWVTSGETLTFYCGVRQDFALDFIGLEGVETTINQKGLPAGLKLIKTITNKTTKAFCYSIGGVPTAASTIKNGNLVASKVVLTASNKYKWHGTFSFDIVVLPLPEWARGTYNGGSDAGQVTLTIADKTGKLSGKQLEDGIVRTLTAESYSATDEGTNFTADVTASWSYKDDKSTVKTNETWSLSVSEGAVGGIVDSAHFTAWQNRWSLQPWKDLGVVLFGKSGTEVCLRGAEYGLKDEELVTLTIKANGTVTTKGVFDLGTLDAKGNRVFYTVSGSTMVSVQSANPFRGLVFVYFPSNVSKGFSGYSQVVPLDEPFD